MNIYSKLLLGAAVFSLAACSSEEPIGAGEGQQPDVIKPTGDVAYLKIRLQSADDSRSRANGDEYLYGDANENAIQNAHFYFYDAAGNFQLKSEAVMGNDVNPAEEYIEMKKEATVVLTGLKESDEYPTWVVTVLNQPNGFEPGSTLAEMGQKIIDNHCITVTENGEDVTYFTMTTSSFFGDGSTTQAINADDHTYFATKLKPENFVEEGQDRGSEVVDIYVERLAARVGVRVDLSNTKYNGATYNGKQLYELQVSVAGENNPDQGSTTSATKVYVAIVGWELNTTAKQTYVMKNLEGWNNQSVIGGSATWWNKPEHFRSFWGKSTTYGKGGVTLLDALKSNTFKWNELTKEVSTARFIGDRAYCNETTNTAENVAYDEELTIVSPQYTPTVVLSAVVCDGEGKPMSLVNYQGIEYTKDQFLKKILSLANARYYVKNSDNEYQQIGVEQVDLASAGLGLGTVTVVVNNGEYFKLKDGAVKNAEGKYAEGDFVAATAKEINDIFVTYTNTSLAIAKTDGAMYYTIPLTHLNKGAGNQIVEGQYGLVRNHIYDLTITKIKSLGEGVFDPEKEEVDPEKPQEPTFYLESAINILSWKIVSQETEI